MARMTKKLRLKLSKDVKAALYLDADRLTDENRQYLNNMAAALGAKTFGKRGFDRVQKALEGFVGSSGDQRLSTDAKDKLSDTVLILKGEAAYYQAADNYANFNKPQAKEALKPRGQIGKQLELYDTELTNKRETNSAQVLGQQVNVDPKTPSAVTSLLNRISDWRDENNLGSKRVFFQQYAKDKTYIELKELVELQVNRLQRETGDKKKRAQELIQLLEQSFHGTSKTAPPKLVAPKPKNLKIKTPVEPSQTKAKEGFKGKIKSLPNFKTKTKGNYPHRVAWLQGNGSWVVVDLNNRTLSTSLELKNVLKSGDMSEDKILKSLTWNQLKNPLDRPYETFRIIKESKSKPKDINFMSFGNRDIKVVSNGFDDHVLRDPEQHADKDGNIREMKYRRSNFKYPRANNRYSIWNKRKSMKKGEVGFKILKRTR